MTKFKIVFQSASSLAFSAADLSKVSKTARRNPDEDVQVRQKEL